MEVKAGYKLTEVGVIPEDWEVVTATQACDLVVDCKNRTPPFVVDSDYAVVRTPNVRDGQFVLEDLRFTDEASYYTWTARAVPQIGDIMITREAPLGEVCAVPKGRKVCLGQRMMLYRPSPTKANSTYLLYSLISLPVRANLLRKIGGSTVGHAKVDDIRFLQLPLPPLPEQRSIATVLSDMDALLGTLDQLIAKKRDLKQATIQQLLTGKKRLPGFVGEWDVKTFGELFSFSGGYSASRDQLSSNGYCYLHYGDIHGSSKTFIDTRIDFQDIPKLDIPIKQISSNSLLDDGDVVFVDASEDNEGASKHVVVMNENNIPFISGLHTIVAKSKTGELTHEYKRYCFQTSAIRQQFLFYAVGTKVLGISKTNIPKLILPVPSLPEQAAIATALSDMDTELAALEQRRDKTRALKQGMMQELLTGRTRLL